MVRAAARRAAQHGGHRLGHAQHVALELRRVGQILAERLLVPDRLGRTVRGHRARVLAPGQRGQVRARWPCRPGGPACRAAARPAPPPCAPRGRADAWPWPGPHPTMPRPDGRAGMPILSSRARSRRPRGPGSTPARLTPSAWPPATPAWRSSWSGRCPRRSRRDSSARTRSRRPRAITSGGPSMPQRPGHVEERLVQPDGLDQRRDVVQDPVQLPADLGVAAVAAGQEDGMRAELPGSHRRHGRMHPVDAGFVGARRHHAAGPAPRRR